MSVLERPRGSADGVVSAAPVAAAVAAAVVEAVPTAAPAAPALVQDAAAVDRPAAVAAVPAVPAAGAAVPAAVAAVQGTPAVRKKVGITLTGQERREANMFAELYSILVATEHLESAFVRGAVSNQDYERSCMQLLAQFKTLHNGMRDKCPDVRAWAREQGLNCPLAEERLLGSGVSATALFGGSASSGSGKESLACFKASEGFITLSDALKLNLTAVDELYPLVRDLQASIVSIPNLPQLAGLERIAGWLVKLNGMRATDQLSEDQCRQLALDMEQAYTVMKNWLQDKT